MECNFDEIETRGKIITKYHSIDFEDNFKESQQEQRFVSYGSTQVLVKLKEGSACYQSIDQLCQPWIQDIYDLETAGAPGHISKCHCLRYNKTLIGGRGPETLVY